MITQPLIPSATNFGVFQKAAWELIDKLARRKSQYALLKSASGLDVCSSLRPKVGKIFTNPELEEKKIKCLENCRLELVGLAIEDAEKDLKDLNASYIDFFLICSR